MPDNNFFNSIFGADHSKFRDDLFIGRPKIFRLKKRKRLNGHLHNLRWMAVDDIGLDSDLLSQCERLGVGSDGHLTKIGRS